MNASGATVRSYRVSLSLRRFTRAAFTLVEMLVTLALLSLIVLALMTVFNSTQKAFRASLTQTDILESGRLAMGLITSDLEAMTPSSSPVNTNRRNFGITEILPTRTITSIFTL